MYIARPFTVSLSLRARSPRWGDPRVASSRHGRFAKLENPQLFLDNGIACGFVAREKEKRKLGLCRSLDLWVREAREEAKEEEKATKEAGRLAVIGRMRQDRCYLERSTRHRYFVITRKSTLHSDIFHLKNTLISAYLYCII